MTPADLKSQLLTILDDILGIYTTEHGKTYPAIWITPPLIDPSWKVEGIAVNINKSPEIQKINPLTNEKLKKRWWNIELIQYDTKQSLVPALEVIQNSYPVLTVRTKSQEVDQYEQAFISIYDPIFGTNEALLSPIFIPNVDSLNENNRDIVYQIGSITKPCYREASYNNNGDLIRISYYTNSTKTTELLRKLFSYSNDNLSVISVTDYTRTPNTTYTTTYNRDGNGNLANWETA
jgi:hypothetical protein